MPLNCNLKESIAIKPYTEKPIICGVSNLVLQVIVLSLIHISSSLFNRPLPTDWAFLADVSLTGELQRIPALESRIRELDSMGR